MADSYLGVSDYLFSILDTFRTIQKLRSADVKGVDSSASAAASLPSCRSTRKRRLRYFDPRLFEVRSSICVAGVKRDAVLKVKSLLAGLLEANDNNSSSSSTTPLALESFHVKCPGDVKDGALFVPKIVLAASHCPGRKLIDGSDDNDGQLDYLYDEVCDIGAEVLVICLSLPRAIYPPNKSFIYHQRVADLLFPNQPVLQSLAMDNTLITVSENASGFNHIQRNVVREWLDRPVGADHRVYRTAAGYMTKAENELSQAAAAAYWSESELTSSYQRQRLPQGLAVGWTALARGFASATEERHDNATSKTGGRKVRQKKRSLYGSASLRNSREADRSELKPLVQRTAYDSQELLLRNDEFDDDWKFSTETECL